MIKNAESMKEQDRIKRVTNFIKELVDLKNEADTAIHTTEKSLSEYKDKLPQADVDEIQAEITKLKEMIADPNLQGAALKDQIEKVKNATMKIGKAMYGQAGAQQDGFAVSDGRLSQAMEQGGVNLLKIVGGGFAGPAVQLD